MKKPSRNLLLAGFVTGIFLMSCPVWLYFLFDQGMLGFFHEWLAEPDTFAVLQKLISLSYVFLAVGAVLGTLCGVMVFRTIAADWEKFKAATKVRESEEKYRLLFSTESDAIMLFDRQTLKVVEINESGLSLYGYGREEIQKKKLSEFFAVPPSFGKGGENMDDLSGETLHLTKSGEEIPVEISTGRFVAGDKDYLCLIVKDIRQRRQLEEAVLNISNEERHRIGHDLHDGLGQELSAASLMAKALENKLRRKSLPEAEELKSLITQINNSISTTRAIAHGLAPVSIEKYGLRAALDKLLTGLEAQTGVTCDLDWPEEIAIDNPTTATHLFRIIQEAVNNAIKHSGTSLITISFERSDSPATILRISDNGKGLDPATEDGSPKGLGMKSLQYRASRLGGRVEIVSGKDQGLTVICHFQNT
ncbi:PAS domain-containing sensor histidine kinase [Geitlerinema calcuttense]|uniref:histidine kinase n=1 Tax=Geitlerinema calcuttense NRMC-F 0142 TaxID=2922238 RepID=A0ABT7M0P0_9CYAN|nr:PAS domain-containing sensor histidine kinase [Geitlerinema calcuttense]MDL5057831.1 PAS domain-containing sensor histidine kinase [Geitlerinema calcuttense NRMC-F 0142]